MNKVRVTEEKRREERKGSIIREKGKTLNVRRKKSVWEGGQKVNFYRGKVSHGRFWSVCWSGHKTICLGSSSLPPPPLFFLLFFLGNSLTYTNWLNAKFNLPRIDPNVLLVCSDPIVRPIRGQGSALTNLPRQLAERMSVRGMDAVELWEYLLKYKQALERTDSKSVCLTMRDCTKPSAEYTTSAAWVNLIQLGSILMLMMKYL